MIAAGFCSVEQREGRQSPAPSSALHPRSLELQARNHVAELDTHDSSFRGPPPQNAGVESFHPYVELRGNSEGQWRAFLMHRHLNARVLREHRGHAAAARWSSAAASVLSPFCSSNRARFASVSNCAPSSSSDSR